MPSIPLTRSKHLIPFGQFAAQAGFRVGRLLEEARLPGGCLEDPDTLIPSGPSFQFRELVARATGLPHVAVEATRHLELADLGDFGRVLCRVPTLGRLLTEFQRLLHTQTSMAAIEVRRQSNGDVLFCHRFEYAPNVGLWHSDLYILQWTLKLVRLVDPNWSPPTVWSCSPVGAGRLTAIEALGARRVDFGHDCTGFAISSSLLARPLVRACDESRPDCGEANLWSTSPAETYVEGLQQVIRAYADERWLTVEQAAEVVGTSVRTLQRQLAAENLSYTEVLGDVRAEVAARLLELSDEPLADIARQLGYVSPGNFSRAFRRWAGVAPREFRRQRRAT